MRVLIAESSPFLAQAIASLVRSQGWQVVGLADDGADAVATAREEKPDIAIIDLHLKEGAAAGERLCAERICPCILLTSSPELYDLQLLDADALLPKPFRDDDLINTMKAVWLKVRGQSYAMPRCAVVPAILPEGRRFLGDGN
ncbi:MAG: response regulator [Parvularcula sp.]|jgi:DNA-binding response OmpR family regulator|nr:response regulator [Parvularcula sp.]